MRAFVALIRREFLEHRGAFFYAPLTLVVLFAIFIALALFSHNVELTIRMAFVTPHKLFDAVYLLTAGLWWAYLGIALFFYAADGFNADSRNNALLFWKSMPQSDLKILMSKVAAALTIFPALVFAATLVTGVLLGIAMFVLPSLLPGIATPDPTSLLISWIQVSAILLCYLIVMLLWYLPFFAWVGGLSTVVGRWSIPLGLLLPVILSLFEGVIDFGSAPGGSYILTFLRERLNFRYDSNTLFAAFFSPDPLDVQAVVASLLADVDWISLVGGIVFAVVIIYLASQYRRRVIKG